MGREGQGLYCSRIEGLCLVVVLLVFVNVPEEEIRLNIFCVPANHIFQDFSGLVDGAGLPEVEGVCVGIFGQVAANFPGPFAPVKGLAEPVIGENDAKIVGGSGGGRPDMAQGGGTDVAALPRVLKDVPAWVADNLG